MILKTVEIQGVRCFSQPVRVDLAKDGFTIISGPNGSGKSTLLAAVTRALLDVHTAAGAADLSSWAAGCPPRIAVEFEHGGKNYRLTKQFVSKRMARLERKDGRTWVVAHEGRQADDAVREMMRCGGRNEAGLLAVLWSAQGELPLDHVPGGVLEDLRTALGAQMSGSSGAAFEKQLRKAFEAGWQPARMQPKKGRLHEIEEHLAKAEAAAEASRSILEEADERARKAREFRDLAATLRAELANLDVKRQAAEAVAREFGELRDQAETCEREHKSSAALYGAFWHRVEQIRTESARRDQLCAAVPELVAALERQRAEETASKAIAGASAQASIEAAQPDRNRAGRGSGTSGRIVGGTCPRHGGAGAQARQVGPVGAVRREDPSGTVHVAGSGQAGTGENPHSPRANSRRASPSGEAGTSARNLGDQRIEPGGRARNSARRCGDPAGRLLCSPR